MILSLFGPDGVGKSVTADALKAAGFYVFSGTGVANWPDQTWYKHLLEQGIDEASLDNEAHFLEKIRRVHQLARDLEKKHMKVVIDSDPLHKTLMHDYRKALPSKELARNQLHRKFIQLSKVANYESGALTHIYFQINNGDTLKQAKIIHERLSLRGSLAPFDPRTLEQSQANIEACRDLKTLLEARGEKVITINTNRTFVPEHLLDQLG